MTIKDQTTLLAQSDEIKTETVSNANTAVRVGTMHEDTIDSMAFRVFPVKTISGTTYTLLADDNGSMLLYTNASGCTVTVPDSLVVGFNALHIQKGAGQVTFIGGGAMTIVNADSFTSTAKLNATAGTIVESANVCNLNGFVGA